MARVALLLLALLFHGASGAVAVTHRGGHHTHAVAISDTGAAEPLRNPRGDVAELLSDAASDPEPEEHADEDSDGLAANEESDQPSAARASPGQEEELVEATPPEANKPAEFVDSHADEANSEEPSDKPSAADDGVEESDDTGRERSRHHRVGNAELAQAREHHVLSRRDAPMVRRHDDMQSSAELVEEDLGEELESEMDLEDTLQRKKQGKSKPKQDCNWANWESWGTCSKTCGKGEKKRSRGIARQAKNGGAECSGKSVESNTCQLMKCTTTTTTTTSTSTTTTTTTTTTIINITKSNASRLRVALSFAALFAALAAA